MAQIDLKANREGIVELITAEIYRSRQIHEHEFGDIIEGFGVIVEEFHEVVEAFRVSKPKYPEGNFKLRTELIQLAAMCQKAVCCIDSDVTQEFYMEIFQKKITGSHIEKVTDMKALGLIQIRFDNLKFKINDLYASVRKVDHFRNSKTTNVVISLAELYTECLQALMSCCFKPIVWGVDCGE